MGLARPAAVKAPSALPGEIGPYYTEQGPRNFYSYWAELMGLRQAAPRRGVRKRTNGGAATKRKAKPAAHANAGRAGAARRNRPLAKSTLQ
jgi:hypothetical protein